MLFTDVMENNLLENTKADMMKCETRDQVNKIYRQARIWVRFHCHYAKACTPSRSQELNCELKKMRWAVLDILEGKNNED